MLTYKTITASEALELIVSTPDTAIIDVRTRDEFNKAPIICAFNLPLYEMLELLENYAFAPDQPIIIHCQSGYRSHVAAKVLTYLGYTNIYAVSEDLVVSLSSSLRA